MPAEQLIALEAALADVSKVYSTARIFTALRARADAEFLPQVNALGARLRRLARTRGLTDESGERAAMEMLALSSRWRAEVDAVRCSPPYQHALRAAAADRQAELAQVIPQVFSGLCALRPAPTLYFPVSPASGRRRPGASPFLAPPECADTILHLLAAGIAPDSETADWWERELPFLVCADTLGALEGPIALRLAAADVGVTVFAEADAPTLRVFTAHLRAPLCVVLARDAGDQWWEAYQESYHAFRDALRQALAARGQTVIMVDG